MSSPRWLNEALNRVVPRGYRLLVALVASALLIALAIWRFDETPLNSLLVPLVVASLMLGPRQLPWFVLFVLLVLALLVPSQDVTTRVALTIVIIFGLGFLVLVASLRRSRLGVAGLQGETMFVDLRDRILRQGGIPALPEQWYAAAELRSAGGTPFAGDFVVASRVGDRLEVAVVDVSGKGQGAGTRALLLSGAIGGLLSALPPAEFLPAANTFLLRQEWQEGFATAIHLSLDLRTGHYDIRSAGHPPAALRHAGSGRWEVLESEGPVLGLIDDATYTVVSGEMRHGDALLLYTDGMVETRSRDISLGIDRMLGQAERLLRGQFEGGATRLIESLGSRNDDRALLLVHRR
ncbi:serine/threonine-protein phosphatase [Nocardioides sp. zg-1308]|uniref:PP2C family protein-serine/threonine phosphatase n=1 Tax=Nocardioides renjunii TaxID=3095075 RepID=A0ABU5K5E9_9ACTN|nr:MULTISPECIES: PP2C family protein-serine/threonine phosphatase [unclassified Nocardioides]MDZ5660178.1 PP2C family protein-serine/threonine phosphatase [Nocardioides sp. S-58]NPD03299.1 serine/threonine-protein phosphatase [Nocardioides sp. zg-1308]